MDYCRTPLSKRNTPDMVWMVGGGLEFRFFDSDRFDSNSVSILFSIPDSISFSIPNSNSISTSTSISDSNSVFEFEFNSRFSIPISSYRGVIYVTRWEDLNEPS
jgi:hypothetical protein